MSGIHINTEYEKDYNANITEVRHLQTPNILLMKLSKCSSWQEDFSFQAHFFSLIRRANDDVPYSNLFAQ